MLARNRPGSRRCRAVLPTGAGWHPLERVARPSARRAAEGTARQERESGVRAVPAAETGWSGPQVAREVTEGDKRENAAVRIGRDSNGSSSLSAHRRDGSPQTGFT
jgi:hypothetical protein